MPIRLISGLPRQGKSLRAVMYIEQAINEGRPVYVHGIPDLKIPGVQPLEDPDKHAELPHGSLIVIDEVQEVWGASRSEAEQSMKDLNRHGHRGHDFIIVTQFPNMIHSWIRGLINPHEHVVRQFGTPSAKIYVWQSVQKEPNGDRVQEMADSFMWLYPKRLYSLYKSSSMHTVKAKVPLRVWYGIAAAVLAAALLFYAYSKATSVGRSDAAPASAAAEPGAAAGRRTQDVELTAETWAQRMEPRIAGIPMSAPIYDDFDVQQYPRVFCMIGGEGSGRADDCRCYTQQATRLDIPLNVCMVYATRGVFDPFAPASQQNDERSRPRVEQGSTTVPATAVGSGVPYGAPIRPVYVPPGQGDPTTPSASGYVGGR